MGVFYLRHCFGLPARGDKSKQTDFLVFLLVCKFSTGNAHAIARTQDRPPPSHPCYTLGGGYLCVGSDPAAKGKWMMPKTERKRESLGSYPRVDRGDGLSGASEGGLIWVRGHAQFTRWNRREGRATGYRGKQAYYFLVSFPEMQLHSEAFHPPTEGGCLGLPLRAL